MVGTAGAIGGDLRAETAARGVKPVSNEHRRRQRRASSDDTTFLQWGGRGSSDTCADMMASGGPFSDVLEEGRHQKPGVHRKTTLCLLKPCTKMREKHATVKRNKREQRGLGKRTAMGWTGVSVRRRRQSQLQLRRSVPLSFQLWYLRHRMIVSGVLLAGSMPRTPTSTTLFPGIVKIVQKRS